MSKTHIPKLRHHKASGQGFVELNGRRHYLGRYELPKTRQRYHDLLQTWEARASPSTSDPMRSPSWSCSRGS